MKLGDFEVREENPFKPIGLKLLKVESTGKTTVLTDSDGVYYEARRLDGDARRISDTLEYRKVYVCSFDLMKNLSIPGWKLLSYILFTLKPDKTSVRLYAPHVMDYCKYKSRNMFYVGIVELLKEGFIARGLDGEYHINVNYFFNGKRTNLKS